MGLPKDLLDILCCAFCKGDLTYAGETLTCRNPECGIVYRVEDDIPIMLIDEAQRPCPKCSSQRDWDGGDVLRCPQCGTTLAVRSSGGR